MEEINTNKYSKEKRMKDSNNNNINSSPLRVGRSYDNINDRNMRIHNFTSYNVTSSDNKHKLNLEEYQNIRPVNQTQRSIGFRCGYHCEPYLCPYYSHCQLHHVHFHHIHIPHTYMCPRINNKTTNISRIENREINKSNNDLIKEVAELRDECKKVKEELQKTRNENEVENKYIKLLENKISFKENSTYDMNQNNNKNNLNKNVEYEKDIKNKEKNNKYHVMLNKSFEVLNSVSNKCEEMKGKIKGDVNYYYNKDPDYDELIEAQKKWLDNLPEKYNISKKVDNFNYNNSTFSNTNRTGTREKFIDENFEENNETNYNDIYYNNMSNFNKSGNNNIDNSNFNNSLKKKFRRTKNTIK